VSTRLFVNLPVGDLQKSIEFFTELGFTFNPQFTDETATCMVVSDEISVMLLTHDKFKQFTPKAICDAPKATEVLLCLALDTGRRWTRWSATHWPPAGRPTTSRRTKASCTDMASRILTATFGN
jgi:predicted lactoylglutathione lyase